MLEQTRSNSARAGRRAAGLALVLAAGLAGCSSDSDAAGLDLQAPTSTASGGDSDSTPRPAQPEATPSPTPSTEEQRILAQYKRFWATLTPAAYEDDDETRLMMLEEVAVSPSLETTMRGMIASDQLGEVSYGKEVVRPELISVEGPLARIRDCQDTSKSGRMKEATGEVVSMGTPEALAEVTMKRGGDRVWRVATVDYKADSC